jgi:hypothetical protein
MGSGKPSSHGVSAGMRSPEWGIEMKNGFVIGGIMG